MVAVEWHSAFPVGLTCKSHATRDQVPGHPHVTSEQAPRALPTSSFTPTSLQSKLLVHPRVTAWQVLGLEAPSRKRTSAGTFETHIEVSKRVSVSNLEFKADLAASVTITSLHQPLSVLSHYVLSNQFVALAPLSYRSITSPALFLQPRKVQTRFLICPNKAWTALSLRPESVFCSSSLILVLLSSNGNSYTESAHQTVICRSVVACECRAVSIKILMIDEFE